MSSGIASLSGNIQQWSHDTDIVQPLGSPAGAHQPEQLLNGDHGQAAAQTAGTVGTGLLSDIGEEGHHTTSKPSAINLGAAGAGPEGQQQQDMECIVSAFSPVAVVGIRSLPNAFHPGYRMELLQQMQAAGEHSMFMCVQLASDSLSYCRCVSMLRSAACAVHACTAHRIGPADGANPPCADQEMVTAPHSNVCQSTL